MQAIIKLSSQILFVCFLALLTLADAATPLRPSDDNLTRVFAAARKSQVKSVNYELSFAFKKGAEEYTGVAKIKAELTDVSRPLSVDFSGKKIDSLKVNGTLLSQYPSRKGSFDIPAAQLKTETLIEVAYTNSFNTEGYGVQRSVDPEDKAEYIFTDFEPYYAHFMFPCFDQPDLKATYKVEVLAPKDWKVVGNDLIANTKTSGEFTTTQLNKSRLFSPYLFFLGVGPWAEWKDEANGIPLVLYSRQTLAKYVDSKRIFEATKKGLKFYADYFGTPYPFPKFGQIFIPEFAWGGMENPGAIALNESSIFRGPVPQNKFDDRDNLILHEMAHMWFGDLVTMSWWNDLWLNESFASYAANIASDRALGAKGAWQDFFSEKTWGYWQDQLVTTHPIETDVPDVRTGKGNFDGITYAKGASTLKQLHFMVGEDAFRSGLQNYFKKFAFKNATRADFIGEIASSAKLELKDWTKSWLQTAGPNRVQAEWACKDGKLTAFKINQKPSSSGQLSPHKTQVGLFKLNSQQGMDLLLSADVAYNGKSTSVPLLKGKDCPDFVYPNLNDQDYALFALDPASLKIAKLVITGSSNDSLMRLMVWSTLAQMVRDAQLSVLEYFDYALAGLEKESDPDVLGSILSRYSPVSNYFSSYLTKEQRQELAPKLEETIWKRMLAQEAGSSLQMNFFDFYTAIAQTSESQSRLVSFLSGKEIPKGITVDQDRRWSLIWNLSRNGNPLALGLIESEGKKDPSTSGQRHMFASRIAYPDAEIKKQFWNDLNQAADKIPFSSLRMATGKFNLPDHVELSEPFVEPFFKAVTTMDWKKHDNLIEIYFERLFPHNLCSPKLLKESEAKLKSAKNLVPLARRAWLESNDELSKCVAVRKVIQQSTQQ